MLSPAPEVSAVRGVALGLNSAVGRVQMSRESHGPALGALWGRPKEESECWEDCMDVDFALWKVSLFGVWVQFTNYNGLLVTLLGPAGVEWGM